MHNGKSLRTRITQDYKINEYAEEGLQKLKDATPVDTGKTKDSWKYEIRGTWIYYYNTNGRVVLYLTDGYVNHDTWIPGNDFVSPILKELSYKMRKGVSHGEGRKYGKIGASLKEI